MRRSKLRTLELPVRVALAGALALLMIGWVVSLGMVARDVDGGLSEALSPEATRLRVCAPPLERAIHTNMRRHIPDPSERRVLVKWMRRGADMTSYYGEPSRVLGRRCASCHGASAQGGVRLQTYADAASLAGRRGRDPYGRRGKLHVHLFAVGAILALLLLALVHTRLPAWLALTAGLTPLAAQLGSTVLAIWGGATGLGPYLLWFCEVLVIGAWPISGTLLLWDLFAPARDRGAADARPDPD
ncbi:MAG: hypothetical protein ABI333_23410 [bacterium]